MHLLPEVDCGPKAWTVLKELHAPTSVVATLMLERELSALRLSEGEPVQPVLDKMRDLYAKSATAGITYPEQTNLPQNQSLWTLEWVRTKILEEDFRRRQLRGGDDGSSGYGMQGSKRGRGRGFGGAGRGAKKDDDSNDQQGGTGWGRGAKSGREGKSGAGGKMKGSCWLPQREGDPTSGERSDGGWHGAVAAVDGIWGDRLGNGTPTLGATAGITYPEQTKCLKMLSLLPESWLQFTSGLSLPQNQSLWTLEWVRTKILEEDFRRRQLRGGDDGSSGYGMQGSKRGRGRGFGGARRGAKKDDDSNDQQGGTGWGRGAKSGRGGKSGARAK
ncbi:unnamed protein product [Closterium sp. NIES-53]